MTSLHLSADGRVGLQRALGDAVRGFVGMRDTAVQGRARRTGPVADLIQLRLGRAVFDAAGHAAWDELAEEAGAQEWLRTLATATNKERLRQGFRLTDAVAQLDALVAATSVDDLSEDLVLRTAPLVQSLARVLVDNARARPRNGTIRLSGSQADIDDAVGDVVDLMWAESGRVRRRSEQRQRAAGLDRSARQASATASRSAKPEPAQARKRAAAGVGGAPEGGVVRSAPVRKARRSTAAAPPSPDPALAARLNDLDADLPYAVGVTVGLSGGASAAARDAVIVAFESAEAIDRLPGDFQYLSERHGPITREDLNAAVADRLASDLRAIAATALRANSAPRSVQGAVRRLTKTARVPPRMAFVESEVLPGVLERHRESQRADDVRWFVPEALDAAVRSAQKLTDVLATDLYAAAVRTAYAEGSLTLAALESAHTTIEVDERALRMRAVHAVTRMRGLSDGYGLPARNAVRRLTDAVQKAAAREAAQAKIQNPWCDAAPPGDVVMTQDPYFSAAVSGNAALAGVRRPGPTRGMLPIRADPQRLARVWMPRSSEAKAVVQSIGQDRLGSS